MWVGYNPNTTFISELTADGAPNHTLMRIISNISYISLLLFAIGMLFISFAKYRTASRFGYASLLLMALISIVGFNAFPMTIDRMLSVQNVLHILITATMIIITIISKFFISGGYLKQDNLKKLGFLSLILTILFAIFNIWLLFAMIGNSNHVGIIQRLGIYTFYIYIFILSCIYTFKFKRIISND